MIPVAFGKNSFASTNVDDTAWVQLPLVSAAGTSLTALPVMISSIRINYTGGEDLLLGYGTSIADAIQFEEIGPNEYGSIDVIISEGHKIFMKASEAGTTVNTGKILIEFKHGRNR